MRYIRIVMYYVKMCIMREMMFRVNFIVRFLTDLSWLLGSLMLLKVLTSQYKTIAGWDSNTLYILFGTHYIINYLMTAFLLINGLILSGNINGGGLDQVLLKPLPSVFAVSFQIVDLSGMVQVLMGVVMVLWGCKTSACTVTLLVFMVYIVQIICGVMILYGMFFSLMYSAFWFKRTQGIESIHYSTYDFRSFPAEVFPPKVRFVFTILIPLTVVANPAAKTLVDGVTINGLGLSLIEAAIWVCISCFILSRGLRRYRGAGA